MPIRSRRFLAVCCALLLPILFCPKARAASETSRLLSSMSLEEKVGQIFMLWFRGPVASEDAAALIRDRHVGGLILYATAGNIESPGQVARLTADMQAVAAATGHGLGLLVGVDQEGGPVARLRKGFTVFPSQMAQAATGRADLARRAASATARELAAVGINVDFAPVADVNVNPANPVIGIRSFGSDPATAARFAAAATTGYRNAGVICTPKHFPGHGDTSVDSHVGLPRVDHDRRTLDRVDFPPFRAALAAGAPAVMTAHVLAPALEPQGLPATLSRRVLGGILRGRMGFSGVIFTDSLGMGAVADTWGTAEAAVLALNAGADILLVGADAGRPASERLLAMDAVVQAVRSGRVPVKRLDAAVARVLRLKQRYGLLVASKLALPAPDAAERADTPQNAALAKRIAVRALTAFGPTKPALPAARDAATLIVRPRLGREAIDALAEAGIDAWHGPQALFLPPDPDAGAIARAEAAARQASKVILLATNARKYPGQRRLAEKLALAAPGRLVLVAAESPYDLPLLPKAAARLAIYGETPAGMAALGDALFTTQLFGGRCPACIAPAGPTLLSTK
ncbi:glycoside hydrolase family 3 domain protein [Solidesulfovibrio fructosivorans JJ]]|uniref:Glycoside hydrolase family 3 domain protein n=1 Tax=Solidesulfovibrio fructosivorans JJ] TaxID=596151 RepID=E1JZ21_SOLFR|nr:beta-N-acetylhexosaminidase [Solidesulfovibrio fructosivorans]EFL50437.1 glycoside hydrolase family 3 domain protein [Solidesulfovibrio fructosivorans JJ]]